MKPDAWLSMIAREITRYPREMGNVWRAGIAVFLLSGCGGSETAATATTNEPETANVQETPATPAERDEPAGATNAENEVLEGRIVDRGPLGHGDCIQQSYEIEQSGGERVWIHFERCGNSDAPLFDSLDTGKRYRFTVERGASPNFGDDPMIVGAEPLPD